VDLLLTTALSMEECITRLNNAIDRPRPCEDYTRSGWATTWNPSPLPGAGRRTHGFGYASGTRPVIGTLSDGQFCLEKRVVDRAGPVARCTGLLCPIARGTLIEIKMSFPGSGGSALVGLLILGLLLIGVLLFDLLIAFIASTQGMQVDSGARLGQCAAMLAVLGLLGAVVSASEQKGHAESKYLLALLEQVCEATRIPSPAPEQGRAYTGKTQRLS
jgi:hypothetical protein